MVNLIKIIAVVDGDLVVLLLVRTTGLRYR